MSINGPLEFYRIGKNETISVEIRGRSSKKTQSPNMENGYIDIFVIYRTFLLI